MDAFEEALQTAFGDRASDFSPALRSRLRAFWREAVDLGLETGHTCGDFNPSTQGPVGPESCDGCRLLKEAGE